MNSCGCATVPAPGATAMTGARARKRPRWPAWVSGAVGVIRRRRPGAGRSSGGLTGSKRCKKPTARWASRLRYRARAGPLRMRSCSGTRWRCTTQARRRAAAWLLEQKGNAIAVDTAIGSVVGHDTTLVGWPWVEGTHSWVEPTAMAILALDREGFGDHPRVAEGIRVVLNRALAHGGWNYGNTSVFGRQLRPQPGTDRPGPAGPGGSRERAPPPSDRSGHRLSAADPPRRPGSDLPGLGGARPAGLERLPSRGRGLAEPSRIRSPRGRPDVTTGLGLLLLAHGENPFVSREPRS